MTDKERAAYRAMREALTVALDQLRWYEEDHATDEQYADRISEAQIALRLADEAEKEDPK